MNRRATGRVTPGRAAVAATVAHARYWLTVAPLVRRELQRWHVHASAIPDATLRRHAVGKLAEAGVHCQVAATLATLAPLRERRRVVTAIVAFEVIYDYLDAVTEQLAAEPLRDGRQLYRALQLALLPTGRTSSWYRHHPQHDDGAYLDMLVVTCRTAFSRLPAARAVAWEALRTAVHCGEAQTRSHLVSRTGTAQLEQWASSCLYGSELTWWERAAGAAASVLTVHALIAAAAERGTTSGEAHRIAEAYLPTCALTTMLDSLVDQRHDDATGEHSYLAYYPGEAAAAERLSALARQALAGAMTLRRAPHHVVTVVGVVAYYLSAPEVGDEHGSLVARRLTDDLPPVLGPVLALFRLWRRLRGRSVARRAARDRRSCSPVTGRSPSAPVRQG
jgi:tetraprenyl-beta-curcumene synthase